MYIYVKVHVYNSSGKTCLKDEAHLSTELERLRCNASRRKKVIRLEIADDRVSNRGLLVNES